MYSDKRYTLFTYFTPNRPPTHTIKGGAYSYWVNWGSTPVHLAPNPNNPPPSPPPPPPPPPRRQLLHTSSKKRTRNAICFRLLRKLRVVKIGLMTDRVNSCSNLTSSIFYVAHGILFTFEAAVHGYKNLFAGKTHTPWYTHTGSRNLSNSAADEKRLCVLESRAWSIKIGNWERDSEAELC